MTDGHTAAPDKYAPALDAVFADLPEEPEARFAAVHEIRTAFHEALARVVEPALSRLIKSMPLESRDDYRNAASIINAKLRALSLGVRLPGRPDLTGILVADPDRNDPDAMRFRVAARDEAGHDIRVLWSRNHPTFLKLGPRTPRIEGGARQR